MSFHSIPQRPTARGLLAALVTMVTLLVGIFAVLAQLWLTSDISREPPLDTWDGIQNWHQARKIRSGEPLYRPQPAFKPHVMARQMDGHEPFSMTESPHPPLLAAVVALTSVDSVRVHTSALGVVLLLATCGFASVLAVLAHHRWTPTRFLWWNGLVFLFPGAHRAFQLGNVEPVVWLLFAMAIASSARLGSGALVLSAAAKPYAVWPLATWGGWLLYAWPEQKVFIDGGTDFYGGELLRTFIDIRDIRPGWREALDRHQIDHVLLSVEDPLPHELARDPGWGLRACDATGVFLTRGHSRNGEEADVLTSCLEARRARNSAGGT